jgi:hypothetical protein
MYPDRNACQISEAYKQYDTNPLGHSCSAQFLALVARGGAVGWGTPLQAGRSRVHWHNPSGRTMDLGSIQPLTEMSTRDISWGKGGRCVGLTTLPPSCADCLEIWEPQPPVTLRACPCLYRDCFTFTITIIDAFVKYTSRWNAALDLYRRFTETRWLYLQLFMIRIHPWPKIASTWNIG